MTAPSLASYSNGISQVSGDNLNTMLQFATTAAQLRAFSPNPAVPFMTVKMQGYSAAGDGGQGTFYWNTVTGTDDGGLTTIVPNGSTAGCWTRLPNSSVAYTPQTVTNAGGVVLTAANVTNQVLVRAGAAGVTDTFPSAAAIIGAMSGMQVGSYRDLLVINTNSGTLALVGGTGVTFTGNTASLPTLTQRLFKIYIASASAVTISLRRHGLWVSYVELLHSPVCVSDEHYFGLGRAVFARSPCSRFFLRHYQHDSIHILSPESV